MKVSDTSSRQEPPFPGLVAFEATARLGSMSAAADELDLTQSAVSQRVLKLEAHVGQRLFVRQGHGVRLTGAGELLMETAADTLQRLRAGFARIEPYRNKQSLLLACPSDFAHGWLMPRLEALRAAHGGLEVWLMSEHDVMAIDRIDVDLVVSRRPLQGADIECVPLLQDRAVAVCAAALAARLQGVAFPKVLDKSPLLLLESAPEWGGVIPPASGRSARRRAATIQDERLLLEAAERGAGIAYVSQVLAADALASGRCVQLSQVPASARPPLWAMRSRLTPRTPMADRVFDWLRAQA
ncbi:MAG TPA: LysR substrate-binding domain-containing protein [Burkholderiaceae bacterium]